MNRTLLALLFPLALVASACHSWFVVDGYEVAYVDGPGEYTRYPRYSYRGGYVYEVGGTYYGHHNNRWVQYRERPRDLPRDYERPGHYR